MTWTGTIAPLKLSVRRKAQMGLTQATDGRSGITSNRLRRHNRVLRHPRWKNPDEGFDNSADLADALVSDAHSQQESSPRPGRRHRLLIRARPRPSWPRAQQSSRLFLPWPWSSESSWPRRRRGVDTTHDTRSTTDMSAVRRRVGSFP